MFPDFQCSRNRIPGLTSAPAVGEMLAGMIAKRLKAEKKEDFTAVRKDIVRVWDADPETVQRMIQKNPAYGNVVCRCETVTEGDSGCYTKTPGSQIPGRH